MASKITKGIIISFWVLFVAAVGTVFLIFTAIAMVQSGMSPRRTARKSNR